jgi:hypothetical protein
MKFPPITYRASLIFFIVLILAALMSSWTFDKYETSFMQQHKTLATQSVRAVASELRFLLDNSSKKVNRFAKQYNESLWQLDKNPDNKEIYNRVHKSLGERFPGYRAFTIANSDGQLLEFGFGKKIGPSCLRNIRQHMIDRHTTVIAAHSDFEEYHFDIMTPWSFNDINKHILFTNYSFDKITRLLEVGQAKQHSLILTNNDDPNLIEITAAGGRDIIQQSRPIRLTDSDVSRIAHSKWIEGTEWVLRDIYDEQLLPDYRLRLWRPLIGAWVIVLLLIGLSLFFIRKAELSPPPVDTNQP